MKNDTAAPLTRLGKPVECPICGGSLFRPRHALLNTRGLTFFKLDWANQKSTLQVCVRCGNILWFLEDGSGTTGPGFTAETPATS